MGGKYEDTIPKTEERIDVGGILTKPSSAPSDALPFLADAKQEIRYHLSGVEAHFHVDAEKLKVSMPLPQLSMIYDDLVNDRRRSFVYRDVANNSQVTFTAGRTTKDELDLAIEVALYKKPNLGPVLTKIGDFVSKSVKKS